jgi:hypothetical protein
MLSGLLFLATNKVVAFSMIAVGAATMITFIYQWLTSPVE